MILPAKAVPTQPHRVPIRKAVRLYADMLAKHPGIAVDHPAIDKSLRRHAQGDAEYHRAVAELKEAVGR